PSYTYSIYGFYACTLNIQTDEGCLASYSGNVTVYALPVIQITSNLARGCEPLDVQFTDISTVPDQAATGNAVQSYIWNFGDGASSTLSNPPHTYVNDGTYDVDLEITTSMGCNLLVTFNNYIIADPLPVADFDWNPDRSTILGPKKYFTDLSDLAAVWWWDFGDGSVDSAAINPVHAYDDTGSYTVKLEVLTVYGCYDDTIKTVYIEPDFALFIPNAFSPNGDGKNEIFRTPLIYPLKYDMYIFDRWGNEIYHTTDWQTGWDGRANNGPREAMQDVYVYLVTVTDAMQKKHRYVGHVTLVK
ncbi:MAG: gliding motility-associated C-terminal domain-containing protein, partial [Bacteroidetes bacterium]|nr:gliding motility-associated C-terminal domain-containing protein [Bacteroidota bacterium]